MYSVLRLHVNKCQGQLTVDCVVIDNMRLSRYISIINAGISDIASLLGLATNIRMSEVTGVTFDCLSDLRFGRHINAGISDIGTADMTKCCKYKYTNVKMYKYTNVQIYKCANVQMCKCRDISIQVFPILALLT